MRRHLDHDASRPASTSRARIALARLSPSSTLTAPPRRVGVADDRDVGKRPIPDGLQDLRNERAALVGQFVGLETEVQNEVLGGGRQGRQRVAENVLDVGLAEDGHRRRRLARETRVVDSRAAASSTPPAGFETTARPTAPSPGSGSRTTRLWPGTGGGSNTLRSAARSTATAEQRDQDRERSCLRHQGVTRSARVVPRTPMTAAGVSRRMESGASLAIRPETYAMTPRTMLSTNPRRPSAGA